MLVGRLWILALFSLAGVMAITQTAAQWEELGQEERRGLGEGAQSFLYQIVPAFLASLVLLVMTIQGT